MIFWCFSENSVHSHNYKEPFFTVQSNVHFRTSLKKITRLTVLAIKHGLQFFKSYSKQELFPFDLVNKKSNY